MVGQLKARGGGGVSVLSEIVFYWHGREVSSE